MNGIVSKFRPDGAQAFEAAYNAARALRSQELADLREQRKRKKASRRRPMPEGLTEAEQRAWRLKEQDRFEAAQRFAENRRFEASLIKERLTEGFRMVGGRMVYGRWREGVHEKGLRSTQFGLPGMLFVAACRRGGDLRTSWDKANLGVESRSKLLSLDMPYVEGNKTFLAYWRIDLDHTWPDVRSFMADVDELVGWRIPFAPHLVAGDTLPDGRFVRPHLYFLLPPGEAVWNDPDDPRCNQRTVKFFEAIYLGIVDALRPLHADPGAPGTTLRGKNPLSPLSTGFVMNDSQFASMSEWAGWVDTNLNRETLVRQRAAEKASLTLEASNSLFTAVQREAYRILRRWYFDSDLKLRATEGAIADSLHEVLEPIAQEMVASLPGRRRISRRQVALLVSRVASYAAKSFDPEKLQRKGIVRKALLHVVDGLKTVRERQQVAAAYAAKEKAEKTLNKLIEAWDLLAVETTEITKSALARVAGVSRTTVQARWADLQAALEGRKGRPVRCIDKKLWTIPAVPEHTTSVGANAEARQDVAPQQSVTVGRPSGTASAIPAGTALHVYGSASASTPVTPAVSRCDTSASRIVVRSTPSLWHEVSDTAPWDDDDETDDWAEIAAQEEFLAADMGRIGCDDPEPPDDWLAGSVTARH